MITLSLKYGSQTVSGLTFSTADQVDIVKGWINCSGVGQKTAYLSAKINGESRVIFGAFSQSNNLDQDLELLLQTNDATEIVYDEGTYMGVKRVIVEAII